MGPELLIPLAVGAATAGASALLTPKPPKPQPTPRMPDPFSPEVTEARRRRIDERRATSGRESTILADDSYSNNFLGE
jgi:hypothetical protein